ncbi:MAG: hypothetical protein FWD64_13285 [Acidobacteriaceae bacterium]|nr:hypothetical protein [Acidobacteriaceae bacterium]
MRRFLCCETTNDEYDAEYPHPEMFGRCSNADPAIRAIWNISWFWYDDIETHKLEGKHELTPETKEIAERCCLFLASDSRYKWRKTKFTSIGGIVTGIFCSVFTALRLKRTRPTVYGEFAQFLNQPEGDASVWPFFRRDELVAAQQAHEAVKGN